MLNHLCPCCGRHCYLDTPQCERGMEYAKTGVIPPRVKKPEGTPGAKQMPEKKRLYLAMDREGKLAYNLKEMGKTVHLAEETAQNEDLFASLREEDRADLLMLLEKVKHDWMHRFGEKRGEK